MLCLYFLFHLIASVFANNDLNFSCAFWALYGHMTNNFTVILVNGVGLFLQSSYIVVYMNFAVKKVGSCGL